MGTKSTSKGSGLRIYGFEEFITALQKLEDKGIDDAAEDCFNECADIVVECLDKKMSETGVPESLKNKIQTTRIISPQTNNYKFAYGWGDADPDAHDKVCYLNYGTPERHNRGAYRGKVEPRYFISNAKRAAANRMKKVQKDTLKKMLGTDGK